MDTIYGAITLVHVARAEVSALLAVAFLLLAVCALTYLHVVPTGLSAVKNAVSHYGITP